MASPSRPLCRCLVGPTRPLHPMPPIQSTQHRTRNTNAQTVALPMSVPKGGAQRHTKAVPPIPPYFWGSGSGAQNEGPRDGESRVDGEKSRTRLPGPQVRAESVCEVCDAQVGHLDGTRPGTLCGRWADNAQRMLKWRQKSELSLVG